MMRGRRYEELVKDRTSDLIGWIWYRRRSCGGYRMSVCMRRAGVGRDTSGEEWRETTVRRRKGETSKETRTRWCSSECGV